MKTTFKITNKIAKLISNISRIEGEISAISRTAEYDFEVQSLVNVESVHFSTKIEGNTLTLKEVTSVLEKKNVKKQNRNLKEILNYSELRNFLFFKQNAKASMTPELILKSHNLTLNKIVIPSHRGKLRTAQNVVKEAHSNKIAYLPPEHADVSTLLEDHLKWLSREMKKNEITPLILSAIFHYVFVTIHPFMDGNGRLARLLSNAILLWSGFETVKYASTEKYFEKNRGRYYQTLRQHQAHQFYLIPQPVDLTLWIEYVLECYEQSFEEALERLSKAKANLSTDRVEKGLALFRRHKKLKASDYSAIMGLGRTQTVEDLNELVRRGSIVKQGGGRSTVYVLKA